MNKSLVLTGCTLVIACLWCACSDDNATTDPIPPSVPAVVTAAVSDVTETSALCGGTVTSDGGAEVTSRGVCWDTSAVATTASSKTTEGTGTGSFTSALSGLTPGTKYYLRAYAANGAGTGYGVTDSFTTVSLLQIRSSFDTDDEGWIVFGGGVYYQTSDGHPGGFVEWEDWEAMSGGFLAPDKFKGDLSAYSGGTLSFDLKNTVDNGSNLALSNYGLIRLTSGTLYAEHNPVPYPSYLTEWTTFSIPLTAEEWSVTPAQWDSILVSVTEVQILMDPQMDLYDRSALDNFTFTASALKAAGDLRDRCTHQPLADR